MDVRDVQQDAYCLDPTVFHLSLSLLDPTDVMDLGPSQ